MTTSGLEFVVWVPVVVVLTRVSPPLAVSPAALTVIVTVSAWLVVPSDTTTMNCNVVALLGAVNVGEVAVELLSVTFGPSICVH